MARGYFPFDGVGGAPLAMELLYRLTRDPRYNLREGYYSTELDHNSNTIRKNRFGKNELNIPMHEVGVGGNIETVSPDDPIFDYLDLIIGGSPCQQFSTMNHTNKVGLLGPDGQRIKLEDTPQSSLALHFFDLIKAANDRYKKLHNNKELPFIVENVNGSRELQKRLTAALGRDELVPAYHINAADFGPINRSRMFYTNADIPYDHISDLGIRQLSDKDIDEMRIPQYQLPLEPDEILSKGWRATKAKLDTPLKSGGTAYEGPALASGLLYGQTVGPSQWSPNDKGDWIRHDNRIGIRADSEIGQRLLATQHKRPSPAFIYTDIDGIVYKIPWSSEFSNNDTAAHFKRVPKDTFMDMSIVPIDQVEHALGYPRGWTDHPYNKQGIRVDRGPDEEYAKYCEKVWRNNRMRRLGNGYSIPVMMALIRRLLGG